MSGSQPRGGDGSQYVRGQFELGRGRIADALAAFRAAERLAGPHPLARPLRAWLVHALVRLGETADAEQVLAGLGERDRDRAEMRIAAAALRLARDGPHAATGALAPVLDGSGGVGWRSWLVEAFLLEAIARDALGDPAAAGHALERALDLAEPDGALLWFVLHPVPDLLERQARQRTGHAALIAQILDLLAGNRPAPPPAGSRPPFEPLSKSEIRVLRYLPTHLTAPEIAGELSVSTSTVKTHLRNLYAKLGAHSRAQAVESARALGLLAPSAHSADSPAAAGWPRLPTIGAHLAMGCANSGGRRAACLRWPGPTILVCRAPPGAARPAVAARCATSPPRCLHG
jgi:LuxR family transcriptional regulator, maltose regulon positive regulatory protein